MIHRGTGHIPDPPSSDDWLASAMLPRTGDPPRQSNGCRAMLAPVDDQYERGRCVGEAISGAISVFHSRQRPCVDAIWLMGRMPDGLTGNSGCYPRTAFDEVRKRGFTFDDWEMPEGVYDDLPPPDLFGNALGAVLKCWRITSEGYQRRVEVRRALSFGYPVCMAFKVDSTFKQLYGDVTWYGPGDRESSSHYMVACAYDPLAFIVQNSWGVDHGANGFCRIDCEVVDNPAWCGDIWVVTAAHLRGA